MSTSDQQWSSEEVEEAKNVSQNSHNFVIGEKSDHYDKTRRFHSLWGGYW